MIMPNCASKAAGLLCKDRIASDHGHGIAMVNESTVLVLGAIFRSSPCCSKVQMITRLRFEHLRNDFNEILVDVLL